MTVLERPELLWLLVPWLLGAWWFGRQQRRSVDWLHLHVSPRFRRALTVHGRGSLRAHLWLLLLAGVLLIYAAAGPKRLGEIEAEAANGRVLLVFDASHSMTSEDLDLPPGLGPELAETSEAVDGSEEIEEWDRFELARYLGQRLTAELPNHHFGMLSYSGTATILLPITDDRVALSEALRTVEWYTMYQNSGSNLASALDAILPFAGHEDERSGDLQVVFLGDGELPFELDYAASLDALARRGVPVHAVAIGGTDGRWHKLYDYRDVVDGKEPDERRVLVEYTSRREDEHFRRIANRTDGDFYRTDGSDLGDGTPDVLANALATTIRERPAQRRISQTQFSSTGDSENSEGDSEAAAEDLGRTPLLLVLAIVLLDTLVIGHLGRRLRSRFEIERLGTRRASTTPPFAGLLLLVLGLGCSDDAWQAYIENERGIERDDASEHSEAAVHYHRSLAYEIQPEIPSYNLARSATLDGRYSEAHDLYQETLQLAPRLAEAHFNDGVALFLWGVAERDPQDCDLSRTLDLWQQATRRFTSAGEFDREAPTVAADADRNHHFLQQQITVLEALIETPPAHCPPPPPDPSSDSSSPPPSAPPPGTPPPGTPPPSTPPPASDPDTGPPPPSGATAPPPGTGPLTDQELDQIHQELDRIAAQAREDGTFHRRTGPEQFSREQWMNPDSEIWW